MKILYCATSDFKPRQGGIAEMTHQIADHLFADGHVPHVIGWDVPGSADFDQTTSYPIVRIPQQRSASQKALDLLADQIEPDLIIVNVLGSCLPECHKIARRKSIPLVVFIYGTDVTMFPNLLARFKVWLSLKWADGIFSCSDFTRHQLPRLGIFKKHTYTMYTGINPSYGKNVVSDDTFVDKLVPQGRKLILTLCRLTERKGIDQAVEATAQLSRTRTDFVHIVAGTGTMEPPLRCLVQERGLQDTILFIGEVTDAQKHALYRRMDAYLMPNRTLKNGDVEGFGTTFLEANIYGKPVIGGRSGGTVEAIEDGKSGYLVDAFDLDTTVKVLNKILDDSHHAQELGEYGRTRAIERFSYSRLVDLFVTQLNTIKGTSS